jgi:hypothetical protein
MPDKQGIQEEKLESKFGSQPDNTGKHSIVIVDDTPDNLRLLVGILKESSYKARPVPKGWPSPCHRPEGPARPDPPGYYDAGN